MPIKVIRLFDSNFTFSHKTASLKSIKVNNILSLMNIQAQKTRFIHKVLADNAILAALQRNKTYVASDIDSGPFRVAFADQLIRQNDRYSSAVEDGEHCDVIKQIADNLSTEFGPILIARRLRIGTVQKALNLYVKSLWCMEPNRPIPPHCPIDRIILEKAGIDDSWTKLDSIDTYRVWMKKVRGRALQDGFDNLAEWELHSWSSDRRG